MAQARLRRFTWLSFTRGMIGRDGYGYAARCILKALRAINPNLPDLDMADEADQGRLEWPVGGPAVCMSLPDWWEFVDAEPLVGFTMHEATRLPAEWPGFINKSAAACLVPCEWNRQVFLDSGVRVPVKVARFGVDPDHFWELERRREGWEPYTFLWHGNGGSDMRKGWDVAYTAFTRAFGGRRDVRLVLHFRQPLCGMPTFADENVEMLVGFLDRPAWRGLLQCADAFVFPSRGEGWGLPPREAAATGLPVLAPGFGGTAEELHEWAIPIRVGGMSAAQYGTYLAGDVGEWAEPDVDHLVELMRWCETHREDAAKVGHLAAIAMRKQTWARTARAILDTVEEVCNG